MKTKKGFTLIELMIVVAIIGILAAIAIPKFADLIKKSKEGATKGSLGELRSALTIYYGENEGIYPVANAVGSPESSTQVAEGAETGVFSNGTGPFLTKYLPAMPLVKLGITNLVDKSNTVYGDTIVNLVAANPALGQGVWWYTGNAPGSIIYVYATTTDSKGVQITSW